jgi:hypothetical protein
MSEAPGYTSRELFHFVGFRHPYQDQENYQTLKKILTDECISHHPHIKGPGETRITINWDADLLMGEFLVPTVTCFADIPFEHLAIHTKKYGRFGLSVERTYLVLHDARPVTYVPYFPGDSGSIAGAALINALRDTYRAFQILVVDKLDSQPVLGHGRIISTPDEAITATRNRFAIDILAFLKPFDTTLADDHLENFYMEREWRKFGNFQLRTDCVQRIVVAREYVDRSKTDLPEYADMVCACPA